VKFIESNEEYGNMTLVVQELENKEVSYIGEKIRRLDIGGCENVDIKEYSKV